MNELPKRVFDVAVAGLGLLVSLPVSLAIAIAVKVADGGPVFYGQERVGRHGCLFIGWKFRTMVPDADTLFGPLQAHGDDARITRVGHILRATAMDELPQLWNILKGDMSFVGPRPLMPLEIELTGTGKAVPIQTIPGYTARHAIMPGLTGIAQVYADRHVPRRHKFRYDLLYVRRRTFSLDVRLILLSLWITARGRWEHRRKQR